MAELAIPLLALGGLFVMSKQSSNDPVPANRSANRSIEGYVNMGRDPSDLPNYKTPVENYPTTNPATRSNHARTRDYDRGLDTNESFFDPNNRSQQQRVDIDTQHISHIDSISGNRISKNEFKHNNMVPFFGGKTTGQSATESANQSILDNSQGSGTYHTRKTEQAPLFNPGDNVQWAHGTPNQTDFIRSRINPSMRMSNTLPDGMEQVRVAPGLNRGYGTEGNNGFNSGMVARDVWQPPTVDELRVASNPKLTYNLSGHEGPAQSKILKRTVMAPMEKRRPDTDYENTPDRWLTTTASGSHKPTSRGEQMLQDVNRTTAVSDYFGVGGDNTGEQYGGSEYEPTTRLEPVGLPISNASATGRNDGPKDDYGGSGYSVRANNRLTTNIGGESQGSIGGLVHAIVSPIMDVLRPTRKTNMVGNARQSGNVAVGMANGPVANSVQRQPTTNREMAVGKIGSNHWNIQGQSTDGYKVLDMRLDPTNRTDTSTAYTGNAGQTNIGNRSYSAEYNQRNNTNKIHATRSNHGGTQMFNQSMNVEFTKTEYDRENNRRLYPNGGVSGVSIPSVDQQGMFRAPSANERAIPAQSNDRMNPSDLSAFKANPYTHSLSSW
jgi:hypothetical protein